jgi:hypothetical protein
MLSEALKEYLVTEVQAIKFAEAMCSLRGGEEIER